MKMRRFRKVVAWLLVVVLVIVAGTAWFVTRTPSSPFDGVTATATPSAALIAQGEYVARLGDCVACHSTADGKPFAGGLKMATPLGTIFTTNITPDKATGIGAYSLADFDRAVRHGVARDGHRLYPAMPYPSYARLSDSDVRALYAYFMHDVHPVHQPNRPTTMSWPMNMRWPLALWNVAFARSEPYQPMPTSQADAQLWNRGAYIVQGPGHCGSCHTPRGSLMNEKALDGRSPLYLSGAGLDGWYAPSLRGDGGMGLGQWSGQDIIQFLRTGRNMHAVVFGSMADAFNNSTQFMTDGDLKAIAYYLKSLPGLAVAGGSAQPASTSVHAASASGPVADTAGARIYMAKCSFCHGREGQGQQQWIPPLAGSASSMAEDDASSINVTLNGSARVVAAGVPDAYRMVPFRDQLSDQDIADVLSFVRTSWGNTGGSVSPQAVKKLRERTNPASSDVIVLQMR
ncbi:cytochrome c [Dyella sp. A6]|uniref:c-type cytochrome n=1 Tax=Dyella aluminiiresistens TaxID=3069105 RepID=UPI002E787CB4|nr:cytochrome c [Dyella sp. A6]